jgi:cytochrome c551/c552
MKLISTIFLLLTVFVGNLFAAPRVKIVTEYVTPNMYASNTAFTADSTVATGLRTIAKGTYVYLRAWNFGDANPITGITWTFNQKPTGSTAVFSNVTGLSNWQKFKADLTGTYEIKVSIVTAGGSKDTTAFIYAATFVGTGGFDSVAAAFPNCMTCHGSTPKFQDIFNKWKTTSHATKFKSMITAGPASYGINQFRIHTLGYDHYIATDNNGFDDKARTLGWNWTSYAPPKSSNWDSLKRKFPSLVAFSNVGCESCHGPGSEHVYGGGDTNKIMKSVDEGSCGKCHNTPESGHEFAQWKNARHSQVVWSSSFAQNNYATPNDLGNCIRCHDGQGYVNFTKGKSTFTNGMSQAKHEMVACASCHDPHSGTLRTRPTNSDTLANGFHYTGVGSGIVCLDCHKARKDAVSYPQTRVTNANWGPHHNSQGDLYLGQNLATFGGTPYRQTQHWAFLQNACVTCHMAPTDTLNPANRDKVGGHALYLHNEATDYDHLEACKNCHFGKTRFDQFIADQDYDGDGTIEPWRKEVEGALTKLRIALPPVGVDSVAWQLVAQDSNNVNLRKAYFNYLSIAEGSERGMHNAKYTIDALVASKNILTGILPQSSEVPAKYEMSQNYPNPFNPSTKINISLLKTSNVKIVVYDITGKEVAILANTVMNAGRYVIDWNAAKAGALSSGVYFYRINAGNFVDVKKMMLLK